MNINPVRNPINPNNRAQKSRLLHEAAKHAHHKHINTEPILTKEEVANIVKNILRTFERQKNMSESEIKKRIMDSEYEARLADAIRRNERAMARSMPDVNPEELRKIVGKENKVTFTQEQVDYIIKAYSKIFKSLKDTSIEEMKSIDKSRTYNPNTAGRQHIH